MRGCFGVTDALQPSRDNVLDGGASDAANDGSDGFGGILIHCLEYLDAFGKRQEVFLGQSAQVVDIGKRVPEDRDVALGT